MKTLRLLITLILSGTLLAACNSQPGFHGRITDKNGKPLEGIPVRLDTPNSIKLGSDFGTQIDLTDSRGYYSFSDQDTGDYVLSLRWETNSLKCPVLEQGLPITTMQGFIVTEGTSEYARVFSGTKEVKYTKGSSAGFDLKVPCTGEAPGLPPTLDPTFVAQQVPLPQPTPTLEPCLTRLTNQFEPFKSLGEASSTTPSVDLTGTSWKVTSTWKGNPMPFLYNLTFLPNSVLAFQETSPFPYDDSSSCWKQVGDTVYLVTTGINGQGQVSGETITGTGSDNNIEWTWTATKK